MYQLGRVSCGMKKKHVIPVRKKVTSRFSYQPFICFPLVEMSFKGLVYNSLYECLIENYLISSSKSGLKPGDLCANQLLSITHKKYQSLTLGAFSLTSKAFDNNKQ